jgi:N-acetylmuramate 1-kinase
MNAPTADARVRLIEAWLRDELHWPLARLAPASADASFRRYFRVWRADGVTRVVMDAPPDKEDVVTYMRVSALLERCSLHVPHIEAADTRRGLILLEDLGATHLLSRLQEGADADALYGDALQSLTRLQLASPTLTAELPPYDRAVLAREMALMPEWFCRRHLRLAEDDESRALLQGTAEFLVREILQQPIVLVHRDYHARNLMITPERSPGVIDFQDALAGPIGYDLVSLLKDCYIDWPRSRVEGWVRAHHARLRAAGMSLAGESQFLRWFDLVGLQRHIKVLGIFARLWYRDGKSGYLADLPRTLEYVRDTAHRYDELAGFGAWVESALVPALPAANLRAIHEAAASPRTSR